MSAQRQKQALVRDRIAEIQQKLESFETRNIYSANDDPNHGIGAARQWIAAQFKSYSPKLQVSFDKHGLVGSPEKRLFRNVEIWKSLAARKDEALGRMERTTGQVRQILDDGKADGSFDPAVPTTLMLRAFMHALTLGRPEPGSGLEDLPQADLAAHVARVFFEGIRGRATGG